MIQHAELKHIRKSFESNTHQLNDLSRGFESFFSERGYAFQEPRPLVNPSSNQPMEPEFTVDQLSHLRKPILNEELPYPGEATVQDCLRTQNLYKGGLDNHVKSEAPLPFCLHFRMLSVTTPATQNTVKDGWEYLTKKVGIKEENLLIKVSEHDTELLNALRENGIPEDRLLIMKEVDNPQKPDEARPSYFAWDYGVAGGFDKIGGRGLTYAVQNADGEGHTDIGNLVAIKRRDGDKRTIAWEYGFGLEVLGATLKAEKTTIRAGEMGDLVEKYTGSKEGWNNQWDVVADCVVAASNIVSADIKPEGSSRGSRILRDILRKAVEVGVSIGLTPEDIAVMMADYSTLRFGKEKNSENIEPIILEYFSRNERKHSANADEIVTVLVKEMAGQPGMHVIAQGLLGFRWALPQYKIDVIADIRQSYSSLGQEELVSKNINLATAGRILSFRSMGKVIFLTIGLPGKDAIQIMVKADEEGISAQGIKEFTASVKTGDWIECMGSLIKTKTNELTISASELPHVLTPALVPANAKHSNGNELKAGIRTTEEEIRMTRILEARAKMYRSIRTDLQGLGFNEVETSIIEEMAGGASASPFNTYINAIKQPGVLRIAPELKLKPLLRLLPRIFEIGKSFRNEGVDGTHNPEFTTVEGYWSYAKAYEDLVPLMKNLIVNAALAVNGNTTVQLGSQSIDLGQEWKLATFGSLILENTGIDIDPIVHLPEDEGKAALKPQLEAHKIEIEGYDNASMGKILDSLYKKTVRPKVIEPTVITHYPTAIVPLARPNDADPAYNDMFQVVAGGTELVKAYQELNDPITQLRKFIDQAKARAQGDDEAMRINWDFLEELIKGIPPCAGFGIGLDRMLAFLLNEPDIRKNLPYPIGR